MNIKPFDKKIWLSSPTMHGDEIKYICYAVMRSTNCQPPKELGEHYQWLPLDKDDPLSDGYFIVFQDATDLKIVEL